MIMDAAGKHSRWWIRNIRNTSTQAQLQMLQSECFAVPELIGSTWIDLFLFFAAHVAIVETLMKFPTQLCQALLFQRSTIDQWKFKKTMHAGHALASAGKRQYATMKRWLSSCDRERPQMITPKATRRNYWYLKCWIWWFGCVLLEPGLLMGQMICNSDCRPFPSPHEPSCCGH